MTLPVFILINDEVVNIMSVKNIYQDERRIVFDYGEYEINTYFESSQAAVEAFVKLKVKMIENNLVGII